MPSKLATCSDLSLSRGQLALNSVNGICFPQTIQNKSDLSKLYLSTPCFSLDQRYQSSSFSLGAGGSTGGIPANGVCKWETYANEQNRPIGLHDTLREWKKWQNHPITGHLCYKTTLMQIFESKYQTICFEHLAILVFRCGCPHSLKKHGGINRYWFGEIFKGWYQIGDKICCYKTLKMKRHSISHDIIGDLGSCEAGVRFANGIPSQIRLAISIANQICNFLLRSHRS